MYFIQMTQQQWDKSQRNSQAIATRDALSLCHRMPEKPQYLIPNQLCIDEHLHLSVPQKRITLAVNSNNVLKVHDLLLDMETARVFIDAKAQSLTADDETHYDLTQGWLTYDYTGRSRVEHEGKLFWLYERFSIHIAYQSTYIKDIFTQTEPEYRVVINTLEAHH